MLLTRNSMESMAGQPKIRLSLIARKPKGAARLLLGIQTFLGYLQTFLGSGIGGKSKNSKLFWGRELGSVFGVWNPKIAKKVHKKYQKQAVERLPVLVSKI